MRPHPPALLTPEQRQFFTELPDDMPEREIARHYTLSEHDLAVIARQRGSTNRLGFAVQLCMLRYPGRPLTDLLDVPRPILTYIADQVGIPIEHFHAYGRRESTIYEHLQRIRQVYGFHDYGFFEMLHLARHLLPQALENDRRLPLIHSALVFMRNQQIIAPAMSTVERLVWIVRHTARRWVTEWLSRDLSRAQGNQMDRLLLPSSELGGHAPLVWLRAAPAEPSSRNLNRLIDKIRFVEGLGLPPVFAQLHAGRLRDLARRASRTSMQSLSRIRNPARRRALLRAHLIELSYDLHDDTIEMFDRFIGDLLRQGERKQERTILHDAREIHRNLHTLTDAAEALLIARMEGLDPFETVFAEVDEEILMAVVASVRSDARPRDLDPLDLVEHRYLRRRPALLRMYESLEFDPVRGQDPSLDALNHVVLLETHDRRVRAVRQQIEDQTFHAPLEHLGRSRWRRHALDRSHINPNYYELAGFNGLRTGVRSGDIAVGGSRRFQDFESYLIPRTQWQTMRDTGQTGLSISGTAREYLDATDAEIHRRAVRLLDGLPHNESLFVDARGFLQLRPLEKATPPEAESWRRRLYSILPLMQLPDLILEVDAWTGFLDQMLHQGDGQPISRERKGLLAAVMMALGMNIGLDKMAQASPFTASQLSWAESWFITPENLTRALGVLDNFTLAQPLSHFWGRGTASSSDAIRIPVGVSSAHAEYYPPRLGKRRGVSVVTHIADIGLPFGPVMICAPNQEALHVIDALNHHETDLNIREHYTDQAGATFHVFALCAMHGFGFAPNYRQMDEQLLHTVTRTPLGGPLSLVQRGPTRVRPLERNWDEGLRLGASVRHGTVSAALIMRKLASYPRQNQLASALVEIGKLERTLFILDFLHDEALRRRVRIGLNWQEAVHSLARALFIGQEGEFRDRSFNDQLHRASCLMLLVAVIGAWNAIYLQKALDTLASLGSEVPLELLVHISPLGWEHINLLGRYAFNAREGRSLDNLRDLRLTSSIRQGRLWE